MGYFLEAFAAVWVLGAAISAVILILATAADLGANDRNIEPLNTAALIVGLAVLWPWSLCDFINFQIQQGDRA